MKVAVLFCLIALAFAVSQENGVYVLDEASWDSWMAEHDNVLAEFYAPWCGHCKSLAPEYDAAAQALGSSASLVKVDATENRELATRFGIQGFPTLFWFPKGSDEPVPYTGGRTSATIQSWIKRQIMSDIPLLATQAEFDSFVNERESDLFASIVQLGGDTDPALLNLAKSNEFVAVARVASGSGFSNVEDGKMIMHRNHGDPISSALLSSEELDAWVDANAFPLVVEFSQPALGRLQNRDFIIIAVEDLSNEEKKQNVIKILNEVAEGKPELGLLYGDSATLGRAVESVGATGKVFPTCVVVNFKTGQQMAYDEELEFNAENLNNWAAGLYTGSTKPFKKSEPIPESNDGPVTVLVQKNFDELLASKPAFVKYYAPWCGHCKQLAPVWEELGAAFANENVIIGKIDATANYIDAEVRGYPTLIWHANGNSEVFQEADRSLEALTAFVRSKLGKSNEEL